MGNNSSVESAVCVVESKNIKGIIRFNKYNNYV